MARNTRQKTKTDNSESSSVPNTQENNDDEVSIAEKRIAAMVNRVRQLSQDFKRKIRLEWDADGKPCCKLSSLMESYLGHMTRIRVPILYDDWRLVPDEVKDTVYDIIAQAFEIPDDIAKDHIYKSANSKWKDFKSTLNEAARNQITEPPENFIDQETWDEYLRKRCTKDFNDKSERNRQIAKQVEYPYRLSRKGYARKAREMLIERGEDLATSRISRADRWLVARQTVNGKLDPGVERVAKKIAALKEQESQGLIKPTGRNDILAMALGTDEHPGRVRCVGLGVTSKQYFGDQGKRRCVRAYQQEVVGLKGQVTHLQNQVDLLHKMMMEMQGQGSQGEHNHLSRDDSSSLMNSYSNGEPNKGEWKKCELYWPDRTILVAKGRVLILEDGSYTILHGTVVDSNCFRVTVDTVVDGQENADVPYATKEVSCIEDAIGTFVAWPKDMVIYGSDWDTSKGTKISGSKPSQCKTAFLERAQSQPSNVISRVSSMLTCIDKLDIVINTPYITQEEHFIHIGKDELNIWLEHKKLEAVHIAIYMRCLYEHQNSSKYAFLCPENLAWPIGHEPNKKTRAQYMAKSMHNLDMRGRLWLAPYNGGLHWMLAVIDPLQSTIYWLDPAGSDVRSDFRDVATMAMKKFNAKLFMDNSEDGNKKSKRTKKEIEWKVIKCPTQPNDYECGYYICRYMLEIIESGVAQIADTFFEGSLGCYKDEHINEIHKECLEFLEPFIQAEINH